MLRFLFGNPFKGVRPFVAALIMYGIVYWWYNSSLGGHHTPDASAREGIVFALITAGAGILGKFRGLGD